MVNVRRAYITQLARMGVMSGEKMGVMEQQNYI
jgi:hypothetical protein